MSKVYKTGNKLVVNLPIDVIKTLSLKEGDEIDFFQQSQKYFIVARKDDIAQLLTRMLLQHEVAAETSTGGSQTPTPLEKAEKGIEITQEQLEVLKKLDTLRYNDRTTEKVENLLNSNEIKILAELEKKGYVIRFKKSSSEAPKYSIAKEVYDKFLYRKNANLGKPMQQANNENNKRQEYVNPKYVYNAQKAQSNSDTRNIENPYQQILEKEGYVVLNTEEDASALSVALEDSIKHGLVIGTRAFNKKYYIALRSFIDTNAPKLFDLIKDKSMSVDELASKTGISPEAIRTIMYITAENGEVTEIRRDIFKLT
ncbi:MAG: AbrB/MazE/SpoVT family DNA-binding domain-containing protein [Candidatus Micrarchaeia archaeon]